MTQSFTIIEPHADDAFLSLGKHIEDWVKEGHKVTIVTVFSGTRKRAIDAGTYAMKVGTAWIGLGYVEGIGETLPDFEFSWEGQLVLPLALTHWEHKLVREVFEGSPKQSIMYPYWFYLDQPYANMQKNSAVTTDLLTDMKIVSYKKPGLRKYRHCPIFKDQAKFFHFNPPEKLRECVELIVRY
jgi:hypothetical protein